MIKQIFINASGNDPIINAYVPEIILPVILITLNLITEDINMEITTRNDPKYPNNSRYNELSKPITSS